MPEFKRIGPHILDHNGKTIETKIKLHNASYIKIDEGNLGTHFLLKFSTDVGNGWWVDPRALRELITELLYIRREIVEHFGDDEELDALAGERVEVEQPVVHQKIIWEFKEAKNELDDLA